MGLWEKLQREIDRAGHAAKGALDEGKTRIDLFRVRQLADKAAEALGYAIHRAQRDGKELNAETLASLHKTLADHEAEATRLEAELAKGREASAEPAAESAAEPATAGTASAASAAPSEPGTPASS